jgi:hypothetical protein
LTKNSGYLAFSQSKIDLFNEANHELTQDEIQEAIRLSGYTKRDKTELSDTGSYTGFTNTGSSTNLTNTGRMWAMALSGIWKTMMDKDGWKLPATFDSYNICGKGFFKACFGDNYAKRFVYHCGRIGCEICAKRAGSRIAKKIERRITLYSLRIQKLSKGRKTPIASHVIESIEPNSEFWNYTREKQNRVLKRMRVIAGIRGGCVINHLWRFDKSDLTPVYSPHKHLIAFGWIKENASQLIKKELGIDVVYHKVKNGTLRNRVDVFAVAFYQLSHCAVNHKKHSLQWFGELANNKLSNKTLEQYKDEEYILQDEEIERSKCCPVCSERLEPCKINEYFDNWRRYIPPIEIQEKGFEFDSSLFLSLDFNNGEKIPYYDENYHVLYKETLRERKERREALRPDIYGKTTKNQELTCFT